jgi:hypothetical protein
MPGQNSGCIATDATQTANDTTVAIMKKPAHIMTRSFLGAASSHGRAKSRPMPRR